MPWSRLTTTLNTYKEHWQAYRNYVAEEPARYERQTRFARSIHELSVLSSHLRSERTALSDQAANTVLRAAGVMEEEVRAAGNTQLLSQSVEVNIH